MPQPIWESEPCYIIGGGPSLKGFDWTALQGRKVLGCNASFYIGVNIVPVMVFGDGLFLNQHRDGLDSYAKDGGIVISNSRLVNKVDRINPPHYLKHMEKVNKGLVKNGLGWNNSTGACAINLALLFGANPIYLLGYDMQLSPEGEKNFHNAYNDKATPKVYERFLRGMEMVATDVERVFPGHEVINLEDGTSALGVFRKESLQNHFCKEYTV
jgi:hypothetical protein